MSPRSSLLLPFSGPGTRSHKDEKGHIHMLVKRTPYAGKFVTYILPLNSIYMNLNPERYDSRTRKGKVTNLIWILKYVTMSFLDTLCGAGLSHYFLNEGRVLAGEE
ncbi:hypothetical protein SNK03_004932 [Fusarium graminearum]|uniref:Chromosome 2, complete genome n=2 Tax=Gibberella zeae TaxID=5518 RepID=I1RWF8_GIBZE|nr:hypothetical protein FGSG_08625 [Fusarium graminearum PH-1]EYB26358.1 hypothetical protein FG05_08625 [Fusarium graminearum]ESU14694.1 hypothetical protein FGSG_08625 [Fusarium graminearum PH-1]CAF3463982.1 unnamed protein product [Fusarium graminearum]CAF3497406.1 unnamed protein product [Fusarium graminearum]CAG1975712.1 unnamed protein product [Fusarium graminearum]|eukprot:XP_011320119.1 hypothetical protein FGSG_08625 [Fusarium graminearum PH-1]